ncbi:threonine dehydratase [Liquorilactobacillus sucicola DSM 21376 = JCM 15457]|uniref:L-threonine dehydratase n=1 Tax=Liquorilactobacillus sucicola DSM 21376 = JCM 15457 TaxID=1423806 RepID=A0A023CYQ8_9LACO|nr:threonine ammonia-lyase IlvA [Liquorilactobacillus sucicola]KRN07673.1 threonine dehydratase [Liquorilactobacillus sucicola DSM 21376 = JCM 15457]GAJ26691.1 threonine dehydratase [Liquorilactobacillus sucicola DSM 21376 = JCM 15457]
MDVITKKELLKKKDIEEAYEVLRPIIKRTPLQYDTYLSKKYQCHVYLKREDLQAVRSFKIRGAYYAISQTPPAVRQKGVVCASAGNHAQGVAWTCHQMKIPAVVFMPTTTPQQKVAQVRFFGGSETTIKLVGDTFDASAQAATDFCQKNGLTFIAPFNDKRTIAGQGTIAYEIFDDACAHNMKVDYLFAAVGGGGLISGLAAYTKDVSPQTQVVGVEPTGAASMAEAFKCGHPVTLAKVDKFVDGAAVKTVGTLTYRNAKEYVDKMVNVAEGHVCTTLLDLYSKEAIIAEPAGALSVAALEDQRAEIVGKTVVCVISGGNNDIDRMQEIKERSLIYEGYQHYFIVNFPQRPGALREVVDDVLNKDDDITKFEYTKKVNRGKGPVLIGIRLGSKNNIEQLRTKLGEFDPHYIDLKENQMLYEMMV